MADDGRAQRAEARERRRSLASKPFEELNDAAGSGDEQSGALAGAKGPVATAAAAALAGALAGAAKAYADRRGRAKQQHEEPDEEPDEEPEDRPEQEPPAEPTDEAEPQEGDDEPQPEAEADPEPDEEQATNEHEDSQNDENGAHGASAGDASRVVKQAREHLNELFGIEAESVSGLQRSNGSWHVTVEAVEVRRVPESQDVLASYEVVLDDDGGVVSIERTHRYRRAQVESD